MECADDLVTHLVKLISPSRLWRSHRDAHRHNYRRPLSATANQIDPDTR